MHAPNQSLPLPSSAGTIPVASSVKPPRLDAVDWLRGVIMVAMALDHVRDCFTNVTYNPLDFEQTSVWLFLTRWITHYCAPNFVFLAGTGAFLGAARGKSKAELSRFLWTRGLWLLFLELTVIRFSWAFNFDFRFIGVQVFWALGWSMIALAALVWLRTAMVTAIGLVMIVGHNAFDVFKGPDSGWGEVLWSWLHQPKLLDFGPNLKFLIGYPVIPWIGVMAAGYGFGELLQLPRERRRPLLLKLGLALTAAFIVLRFLNLYGDAKPWSPKQNAIFTVLSFVDCTKYPPSLLYLLMTIGPGIFLIGLADRELGALARPFVIFGRVPMFYYLLHMPLIHGLAVVIAAVAAPQNLKGALGSFYFAPTPPGYGYDLWVVYVVWLVVVLILYAPCRWFADLKRRRKDAWLSYF